MLAKTSILAVDIGNTRAKFAVVCGDKIINFKAIASKPEIDIKQLITTVDNIIANNSFNAVLVSSVVPHNNSIIRAFLKDKLLCQVYFVERGIDLIVKEKYGSGKAGIDILCKSAFLANKNQAALCIDSGTATVINYVNKNGFLESVAIAAGFRGMHKALHNDAALLPFFEPGIATKLLNNNTESAVIGGNYFAYLGMLNALVKQAKKETGCRKVYFTGGYSFLFKDMVEFTHVYDPYLLFRGMYLIYSKNKEFFKN